MLKIIIVLSLFLINFSDIVSQTEPDYIKSVPSVREWEKGKDVFAFGKNSRIIINDKFYEQLIDDINTFNEDLENLSGYRLSISSGGTPFNMDIYFTIGAYDSLLGTEGYIMNISDKIEVSANSSKGIFYATRTLLQLIKFYGSIPQGKIKDWPDRAERSFFIDNGRKYFTVKWLENHIKDLSYNKLNYFYFYLGDNDDYRLESENYPDAVSEEHYSKEEIRDLQKLAKKYHVTIVPVINMPGHMGALLRNRKELCLTDYEGGRADFFLDISLDESRNFIKKLLEEYLPLFDGHYWHMGGDEYKYINLHEHPQFLEFATEKYGPDAQALDTYFDFVNFINQIVRAHGKTLRIFNDAISIRHTYPANYHARIDTNIIVDYWEGRDFPTQYIEQGYKISNCAWNYLYYVTGSGWLIYDYFMYERWEIHQFNELKEVPRDHPNNLGSTFLVWCDHPNTETEGHIANEIMNTLRVLSTRLWGGPKIAGNYHAFKELSESIGRAPGVIFDENPMPGNIAWKKQVMVSSIPLDSTYTIKAVNDGSYNTFWRSNSNKNEWVMIDLDTVYKVDLLKLIWIKQMPEKFSVEVSKDLQSWYTINLKPVTDSRLTIIDSIDYTFRYIKINLISTSDTTFKLWEVVAYGDKEIESNVNYDYNSDDIKVYPQPVYEKLTIASNSDLVNIISIDISDIQGRKLFSREFNKNEVEIDISLLPAGNYFVRISTDNGIYRKKIIKLNSH